jgi:lipopolysaccharide/colanic/teichoic acid biosynthesis glycosyltransferase
MKESFYVQAGKRLLDFLLAGTGFLLLLPILTIVGLAVRLSSRGPMLFQHIRVGKSGQQFAMLKFRSMRVGSENGSPLTAAGDPRVTRLGAWLRRTKVDELPQLWNVVRGEMSLVGPRPEVPAFVGKYTERQRQVLKARPGITGPEIDVYEEELLASRIDKEEFYLTTVMPAKLRIDLEYVRNIRFSTDVMILLQTFKKLLIRVHAPYKGAAHSPPTSLEVQSSKK